MATNLFGKEYHGVSLPMASFSRAVRALRGDCAAWEIVSWSFMLFVTTLEFADDTYSIFTKW